MTELLLPPRMPKRVGLGFALGMARTGGNAVEEALHDVTTNARNWAAAAPGALFGAMSTFAGPGIEQAQSLATQLTMGAIKSLTQTDLFGSAAHFADTARAAFGPTFTAMRAGAEGAVALFNDGTRILTPITAMFREPSWQNVSATMSVVGTVAGRVNPMAGAVVQVVGSIVGMIGQFFDWFSSHEPPPLDDMGELLTALDAVPVSDGLRSLFDSILQWPGRDPAVDRRFDGERSAPYWTAEGVDHIDLAEGLLWCQLVRMRKGPPAVHSPTASFDTIHSECDDYLYRRYYPCSSGASRPVDPIPHCHTCREKVFGACGNDSERCDCGGGRSDCLASRAACRQDLVDYGARKIYGRLLQYLTIHHTWKALSSAALGGFGLDTLPVFSGEKFANDRLAEASVWMQRETIARQAGWLLDKFGIGPDGDNQHHPAVLDYHAVWVRPNIQVRRSEMMPPGQTYDRLTPYNQRMLDIYSERQALTMQAPVGPAATACRYDPAAGLYDMNGGQRASRDVIVVPIEVWQYAYELLPDPSVLFVDAQHRAGRLSEYDIVGLREKGFAPGVRLSARVPSESPDEVLMRQHTEYGEINAAAVLAREDRRLASLTRNRPVEATSSTSSALRVVGIGAAIGLGLWGIWKVTRTRQRMAPVRTAPLASSFPPRARLGAARRRSRSR